MCKKATLRKNSIHVTMAVRHRMNLNYKSKMPLIVSFLGLFGVFDSMSIYPLDHLIRAEPQILKQGKDPNVMNLRR